MDAAEAEAVADERLSGLSVADDVRGVEEPHLLQPADRALAAVCGQDLSSKPGLTERRARPRLAARGCRAGRSGRRGTSRARPLQSPGPRRATTRRSRSRALQDRAGRRPGECPSCTRGTGRVDRGRGIRRRGPPCTGRLHRTSRTAHRATQSRSYVRRRPAREAFSRRPDKRGSGRWAAPGRLPAAGMIAVSPRPEAR